MIRNGIGTHIHYTYQLLLTFISELPHPYQQTNADKSADRESKWSSVIFRLGALVSFSFAIASAGIYVWTLLNISNGKSRDINHEDIHMSY